MGFDGVWLAWGMTKGMAGVLFGWMMMAPHLTAGMFQGRLTIAEAPPMSPTGLSSWTPQERRFAPLSILTLTCAKAGCWLFFFGTCSTIIQCIVFFLGIENCHNSWPWLQDRLFARWTSSEQVLHASHKTIQKPEDESNVWSWSSKGADFDFARFGRSDEIRWEMKGGRGTRDHRPVLMTKQVIPLFAALSSRVGTSARTSIPSSPKLMQLDLQFENDDPQEICHMLWIWPFCIFSLASHFRISVSAGHCLHTVSL